MAKRQMKTMIPKGEQGFTLLEVMVAVSVFSVGMMAVAALELVALNGYSSARDQARGSEIARRVISIMRVEAINWGVRGDDLVDNLQPVYSSGAPIGGSSSLLRTMVDNAWAWESVNPDPVDVRLESAAATHGRYCVFVRGDYKAPVLADSSDPTSAPVSAKMIQAQVAVVSPGPTNTLAGPGSCADLANRCTANLDALLEPKDDNLDIELCGLRVVHSSAIIKKLDNGGQR